jgi:hypothetical protein
VSGLAHPVTFGALGVGQMPRAKSFDEAIELLFVCKCRGEMSVDLLMSSHFLAVEYGDTSSAGGKHGILGNRMGRVRFFGENFKLFERGHRLKNGVIAQRNRASERRDTSDGGRPEATNQGTAIDRRQPDNIKRKNRLGRFRASNKRPDVRLLLVVQVLGRSGLRSRPRRVRAQS